MIPENVTLVVKAPNQQIEDQSIQCQTTWTVKQLKGHLAEVYPSKPRAEEQKIIYSGQLLDDNSILKDVLRSYDDHNHFTMHLVCASKRYIPERPQTVPETEGIRRRIIENTNQEQVLPELRQNDQNHTAEMQNYVNSFANNYGRVPPYPNYNNFGDYLNVTNDPAGMANQMMIMQQAYINYMQQYANMMQAGNNAPVVQQAAPAAAPQQPPAPAAAAPQRDFLDQLYCVSRMLVLASLLYVYSSPLRLLFVAAALAAGYWHHIGFFRDLDVNRNADAPENAQNGAENAQNGAQNAQNGAQNAQNGAQNAQNGAQNAQNDAQNAQNEAEIAQNGAANAQVQAENTPAADIVNNNTVNNNHESLMGLTITIFTSFFASLLPDTA